MTTPIKSMSAEECLEEIEIHMGAWWMANTFPGNEGKTPLPRAEIRRALASHLAYVKERMPPEKDARIKEWSNPRDYVEDFSYRESEERSLRALAYNDAIHRSKEVIQSEIDELTK